MTTATEVVLQSGTPVTALRLAPGISVRRTEGPVGVFVEGVDLADTLTGDQIHSLIAIWNNAGVMILRGQDRLTAERQAQVVEWLRRSGRAGGRRRGPRAPLLEATAAAERRYGAGHGGCCVSRSTSTTGRGWSTS